MPSEPPTRCTTLSIGVARGTCQRSSVEYAAAIAGIIVKPRPMPAHDERGLEQPVGRVGADLREGDRAEHEREQPGDDDRPAADAVGQSPGAVHAQRGAQPLGRHEQPRVERREAAPDLEVERQKQQRAEERGAHEEDRGAGRREAALLEQPHVDHRARACARRAA